ncbi:amidohydrolase family protein [Salinibacterium sp. SYSU T00001]|uniref:amidohydrolase n=1 Tax=Homoserinimonas sedimenticola TaxID=2986805 RepID=UPI0022366B78|nr:amidohydrolase family protein [Salinibacterium sedimenticola]MCW4385063.1 amidohydrolase family protein [Salinibacterium sedimenticola]
MREATGRWGGVLKREIVESGAPVVIVAPTVTMDPEHPRAEAFAMHAGRLLAVGELDAVRAAVPQGTREVTLDGVVLPGLIDAHMHMQRGGLKALDQFPEGTDVDSYMERMLQTPHDPEWRDGEPTMEDRVEGLRRVQPLLHALGFTGVIDPAVTIDEMRGYQETKRRGALTMRTVAMPYPEIGTPEVPTVDEAITYLTGIGASTGFGDDVLRIGPIKVYYDGEGMKGEALLERPWRDGDDFTGVQRVPTEDFQRLVDFCADNGWGVGVHAVGGKAVAEASAAFARAAERASIDDLRFQLIHAYLEPSEESIRTATAAGVIASLQPSIAWNNLEGLIGRLGDRALGLNPVRSWIDAGARVAFGSDGPFFPFDPRLIVWHSMTRLARGVDAPASPEQAISLQEALAAYTVDAAWASMAEDRRGMLRAGMLADFTVIDVDPATCTAEDFRDATVLRTVVGGETVFQAPGA